MAKGCFESSLENGAVSPIGETTTGADRKKAEPGRVSRWPRGLVSAGPEEHSGPKPQLGHRPRRVRRLGVHGSRLSPDGRSIALAVDTRDRGKRYRPFRSFRSLEARRRELGPETDRYTGPGIAWSPDGQWVWFTRYAAPGMQQGMPLWRVPADGGPAQHMSALWPSQLGIRRLSAAPDGSMAASTQTWNYHQWVMRNIPIPTAKR